MLQYKHCAGITMFDNIDFKKFQKESDYISEVFTGENLTDEMMQEAIVLMQKHSTAYQKKKGFPIWNLRQ